MKTGRRPQRSEVRPTVVMVSTTTIMVPSTSSWAVRAFWPRVSVTGLPGFLHRVRTARGTGSLRVAVRLFGLALEGRGLLQP